jgi:hypothetical protein
VNLRRSLELSASFHETREIPDPDPDAERNLKADFGAVSHFVRRVLHGAVVQVETVGLDVR